MKTQCSLGLIAMTAALLLPVAAHANTAKQSFEQGRTQLSKGDLEGSLRSFAAAARADRKNSEYLKQYRVVNQVVTLRKRLDAERDSLPAAGANFNMHCHSFFSYNAAGWSPSRIAWEARRAGWSG